MTIDFKNMQTEIKKGFLGGEKEFAVKTFLDDSNKIMLGRLIPGSSIGMHTHENNSEILYVLEGNGIMLCDGGEEVLSEGMCHYCPKGHTHSFVNNGDNDIVFFAVVPKA